MKLSFVIPVYNVENYLLECCESILKQSTCDCELILVDDGSTDRSSQIVDEIADAYKNVVAVHKQNGGLASARNRGFDIASGEFVSFIDSDDRISGHCLLPILQELEKSSTDILFLDSCKFYPDGSKKSVGYHIESKAINGKSKGEVLKYLASLPKFPDSACMKIYRRQFLLDSVLRFPEDGRVAEDLNYVLESFIAAKSYSALDVAFYEYRQNRTGSITNDIGTKHFQGLQQFIEDAIPVLCDSDYRPKNNDCACCLSFVAYEYSIMLWMLSTIPGSKLDEAVAYLTNYRWLMNYAGGRRAQMTRTALSLLGVRKTSSLLSIYMKVRRN